MRAKADLPCALTAGVFVRLFADDGDGDGEFLDGGMVEGVRGTHDWTGVQGGDVIRLPRAASVAPVLSKNSSVAHEPEQADRKARELRW